MNQKPTYNELESRVKELESLAAEYRTKLSSPEQQLSTLKTGFIEDIADSEQRLLYNYKIFSNMVESLPQRIFIKDNHSVYTLCNRNFARDLGIEPEQIVGKDDFAFFSSELAHAYRADDQEVIATGKSKEITEHFQVGGEMRWAHTVKVPFKDDQGNIVGLMGIYNDITESKRMEEALQKERDQAKMYLDIAGVMMVALDAGGRIVLVNKKGCDILGGYSEEELLGRNWFEVCLPEEIRHEVLGVFNQLISGEIAPVEYYQNPVVTKKGELRIIAFHNTVLRDPSSQITGILFSGEDITAQKQIENEKEKLEEQLRHSQKMEAISTLAGGIAHDFNNMLSIITGNISYALSKLSEHDELFDVLSDVQNGTRQAHSLTHQLLTFAKGGNPVKKETDLNQLLKESAKFVLRGAKSVCEFEFDDDLWPVEVDAGQLNQTISNILINAIHAMPEGGTIRITTQNELIDHKDSKPQKNVKITISDHGIGIPENHLSKIFDPFFTTKQQGSGLGLATTYSIIKKHEGTISVESSIGKGTSFHIYLPAAEINSISDQEKLTIRTVRNANILLMDDQEMILDMARRLFKSMGYNTVVSTDGKQAIEMYKKAFLSQHPYDLVILDLTVPGGMGGYEAMKELLKINPNIKAIVSSGYSNDPIMANFHEYGFCGVIPKPFTKKEIEMTINEVLNKNFDGPGTT